VRPIRRALIPALLATAFVVSIPARAHAHEFRLAPSRFWGEADDVVEIRAGVGKGLVSEWRPFDPSRAVRFVARASRELDLRSVAARGDTVWARLALPDERGVMLAYQSNFAHITLDAATFDAYLKDEGLDAARAARGKLATPGPGRERYRRCAKVWLAGPERGRALRPMGLPLEIVPLDAPGRLPKLRVRLLFEGRPLSGLLVRTWHRSEGNLGAPADTADPFWSGRTDVGGEIEVPVVERGEWLIGAVHMVPCPDREVADWESTWASLVFARPSEGSPTE
jgi:hypothetical protein